MFYENRSLVVRIVKIVFLLFFIAAGPLQALDSEDSSGSGRKKSFRERVVNSLSSKKTQSKVEESNEYRALKANLELHSSKIVWLKDIIIQGASSGILFRNKDAAKHNFFENLTTLYRIELDHLPFLILGDEADVQLFARFSEEIPAFKKAFQQFFEALELIFDQAREDLNVQRDYFNEFSDDFKRGKVEATAALHNVEEKGSAEEHHLTVEHVSGMIHKIYTQYHFFSEALPLLRVYFEEQLFMGQKVEPFNIKKKSKKKLKESEFFPIEQQGQLRKRMDTLLDDHQKMIGSLNSILEAHKEKPVHCDFHLFEAKVAMNQAIASVKKIIEEHKNESWGKRLAREVEEVDIAVNDLINIAKGVLANPDSDNIRWKVPSSSPSPSPSPSASPETLLKRERSERKSSGAKLDWLKRTLSKATLKDNGEQDVASSKKQPLSAKLHWKNKKNSKE